MEEIYDSLINRRLFYEEQKGYHKGTREQNKTKNGAMAWIDFKKACDMVPQNWILDYFKVYKNYSKVIKIIGENIKENLSGRT